MVLAAPVAVLGQAGTGTLRVDPVSGSDSGSCGSVAIPCLTIQRAVNLAFDGESVIVAAGTVTYDPSLDTCTPGNSAVVCVTNKNLTIRGGYGAGEWSDSDPDANLTNIDGEMTTRGVLVEETSGAEASLIIEGLSITRCRGTPRDGQTTGFGGGLSAVASPGQTLDLEIRDAVFSTNDVRGGDTASGAGGSAAGGGLSIRGVAATLERVRFDGNVATGGVGPDRGGLALGGAVFAFASTLTARFISLTDNVAQAGNSTGSGSFGGLLADALGGAVCIEEGSSSTFEDVSASGNQTLGGDAETSAGGAFGGAFFAEGQDDAPADLTIIRSDIRGNSAVGGDGSTGGIGDGGGIIAVKWTDLVLEQVVLIDNLARSGDGRLEHGSASGGAVKATGSAYVGSSTLAMENIIVADNRVELGAGGGNRSGGGGGLLVQNLGAANLTHCTFARNSVSAQPLTGQAIALAGGSGPVDLNVDYSIIADHTDFATAQAIYVATGNTINLNRGLFAGNGTDVGGPGAVMGLGTMISAGDAGFLSPGSPDHDYHILHSSPAIDEATGSVTFIDIDGDERDSLPDIGADEFGASVFSDGFESGDTSAWSVSIP